MKNRMGKEEIMFHLHKHYNKLEELGYNIVGVFLYGSQNYELDYEKSDVDTKAIVLPSLNDIVLSKQPVSTTIDIGNNNLCDVKDIRKMFDCFKKQNINFIELLFTKYYILNPKYEDLYRVMLNNAELIARYNNYASVNCMCGMALEKYNALDHPYPSIKDKIDKYGYDNKQLHHILRINDFIVRYINGEKYSDILIPTNKDYLLSVKTTYKYTLEEAKLLGMNTCEYIKKIKDEYINNNELRINKNVDELMNRTLTKIISKSIKEEVMNIE